MKLKGIRNQDIAVLFIDGAYFNKTCTEIMPKSYIMDFFKLRTTIMDLCNCFIVKIYCYYARPYKGIIWTEEQKHKAIAFQKFVDFVNHIPHFEMRLGYTAQCEREGKTYFQEKKVDVQLAVDAINMFHIKKVRKMIFILGDGDFEPVFEFLATNHCELSLFYKEGSTSRRIHQLTQNKMAMDTLFFQRFGRTFSEGLKIPVINRNL